MEVVRWKGGTVLTSSFRNHMFFCSFAAKNCSLSLDRSTKEFADTGQLCLYGPLLMGQLIMACACLLIRLWQEGLWLIILCTPCKIKWAFWVDWHCDHSLDPCSIGVISLSIILCLISCLDIDGIIINCICILVLEMVSLATNTLAHKLGFFSSNQITSPFKPVHSLRPPDL